MGLEEKYYIDELSRKALNELSEIDNLHKYLNEILERDFSKNNQFEILQEFIKHIKYYPIAATYDRPYSIDRFPVFRVRKNIIHKEENLDLIRTYSYPSSFHCKENGRANIIGNPVFYCSDLPGTAYIESKPEAGDIIFLSQWLIRCHRPTLHIDIFPSELPNSNSWIKVATNRYRDMTNYIQKNLGEKQAAAARQINHFYAEIFKNTPKPYTLTSCISNYYLYYDNQGVDYILYPSVVTNSNTCNMVFHPNFVEEFFKLDKVYVFEVKELLVNMSAVYPIKVGEYHGNSIFWREPLEGDLEFMPEFNSL